MQLTDKDRAQPVPLAEVVSGDEVQAVCAISAGLVQRDVLPAAVLAEVDRAHAEEVRLRHMGVL